MWRWVKAKASCQGGCSCRTARALGPFSWVRPPPLCSCQGAITCWQVHPLFLTSCMKLYQREANTYVFTESCICGGCFRQGFPRTHKQRGGEYISADALNLTREMCVLFGCCAADVYILLFQHTVHNETGSPHSHLFPLNNETLEVEIYKGASLKLLLELCP